MAVDAQVSFVVPSGEEIPQVGDTVEIPLGGGGWWLLGQIVGAVLVPDGVEVTLRFRDELRPTTSTWP
jgi:hypothetical protein